MPAAFRPRPPRFAAPAVAAPVAAAALILAAAALPGAAAGKVTCPIGALDTSAAPPVNVDHIFCGEINRGGRAVGFHSRPGGETPDTVGDIDDITPDTPFPGGYEIRDFTITVHGTSGTKPISTMYPDDCGYDEVLAAIRHAYDTGTISGNRFTGTSGDTCRDADGDAFDILGYTSGSGDGLHINTAFPQ